MNTPRLSNSGPCLPLAIQDGGAHQDVVTLSRTLPTAATGPRCGDGASPVPSRPVAPRRPPVLRCGQLRNEFLATVDSLQHRRAHQISEGFIADYVALNWLEWNGGALRLTMTGTNMCQQMRSVMN